MKVIDLLNKIANGEEVPKKITTQNGAYWYDETNINEFKRYRNPENYYLIDENDLNDEVEILEEEKKIPEKLSTLTYTNRNTISIWNEHRNKINEIIDYLNSKGDE